MATTRATTLAGPLSTFHPPISCFDQIWRSYNGDIVLGNPYDTNCKPSGWNTVVIYSPALCPSSYYSAAGKVVTENGVTETVMSCCPSGFRADEGTYSCLSQVNTARASVVYTYLTGQSTTSLTTTVSGQGVNAHSIQAKYQSSDLELLFATSSTNSASTSSTSESSTSTTGSPATSPTSTTAISTSASIATPTSTSDSSSGLSTGGKAGIGVGVVVGVTAALIIPFLVYRSRKKSRASRQHENHPGTSYDADQKIKEQRMPPSELATRANELSGSEGRDRSELPGS